MKAKIINNKRSFVLLLALIILIAVGIWRLFIYTPASKIITKVGNLPKTAIVTPDNSGSTSSIKKAPTNGGGNTSRNISGPTDTNGKTGSTTPESQWTTAASGAITVEQPIANAALSDDFILSGTATVGTVNYTLIDDNVGVVSEGRLNVVNGKFSGTISFTPHSSGGRLDVFSTNNQGVELNEIQIGVKFQS